MSKKFSSNSSVPAATTGEDIFEIRQCLFSVPGEFFLREDAPSEVECFSLGIDENSSLMSGSLPAAVPPYTKLDDLFGESLSPEVIDKLRFSEMLLISATEDDETVVGGLAIQVESIADEVIAVFCSSQFSMGEDKTARCELLALTDKRFSPFQERKSETVTEGDFKQEKQLQLYFDEDQNVTAIRQEEIGDKAETFQGVLTGEQEGILLSDGLNVLYMRYLMVTNFVGELHTRAIDIQGRVGHAIYQITSPIPTVVNGDIHDTKQVIRSIYYTDGDEPEVSISYYLTSGHLLRHTWNNSNYSIIMNPRSSASACSVSVELEDMCTTMQLYLEELARLLEGAPKDVAPPIEGKSTDVIRTVLSEILNDVSYPSMSVSRMQYANSAENVREVLVEIINQMSLS